MYNNLSGGNKCHFNYFRGVGFIIITFIVKQVGDEQSS